MNENLKQINKIVEIICYIGICVMLIIVGLYVSMYGIGEYKQYISDKETEERRKAEREYYIKIYNANIEPYVNNVLEGSEVKSMIDVIISMNQENIGEDGKFIGIMIEDGTVIESYNQKENLKKACEKANTFSSDEASRIVEGNNTEKNVEKASQHMEALKKAINPQKLYNIKACMYDGQYTWIIISEAK